MQKRNGLPLWGQAVNRPAGGTARATGSKELPAYCIPISLNLTKVPASRLKAVRSGLRPENARGSALLPDIFAPRPLILSC